MVVQSFNYYHMTHSERGIKFVHFAFVNTPISEQ